MLWHEILYQVLNIINTVILTIIGIPFFLQLIYMLFFWVKKKVYPKANKKGKVAFVICARNEEDVIYNTVNNILTKQNYPKELIDVYVCAHNCTDKTAEKALLAGAKVVNLNTEEKVVNVAMKHIFDYVLNSGIEYDFFIRLDADNHINDDFVNYMNDCYQSGVNFARPYETGLNMVQNTFAQACGLYYVFDSRFGSRVRERLGISAHVNGPGSMMSFKMMKEIGGYNCKSIVEDAEFMFDRMLEGRKAHFVEDAVVYEDLPSTLKDTYHRNLRIGSGNMKMFFTKLSKMFFKFFTTFRFSYLEMYLTYFFNIICILLCTWIPAFYIYDFIYLGMAGYQQITVTGYDSTYYLDLFYNTILIASLCIGILFIFCGWTQGILLVCMDYKKMGATSRKELLKGAFLFPLFSVVYIVTMTLGGFSRKAKWHQVKRNKEFS